MDALENLMTRRSIRAFTEEAVHGRRLNRSSTPHDTRRAA